MLMGNSNMVEEARDKYPYHARILGGTEHLKFEILIKKV
jgi:hypothetical protein